MGMDAYARTTVGFLLQPSELWTEVTEGVEKCPEGHVRPDAKAKFCAQCGGKFSLPTKRVATDAYKRFCKEYGHGNAKETAEALRETYDGNDLGFHNVRQLSSSEDRWESNTMVLGFRLSGTGSSRGWGGSETVSVNIEEINEAVVKLAKYREILGVSDREIRVYTSLYVSV
jgi:hypothetical protein